MRQFTLEDRFDLYRTGELPIKPLFVSVDLGEANTNRLIASERFYGFVIVGKTSGAVATLIFDEDQSLAVDAGKWNSAPFPFKSVRITNAAQSGKSFQLVLVRDPCHLSSVFFNYG